ncbi:MAG: hypothetical protein UY50_C0009G0040 [Parcubacteria group bacterium GW2011_GWA2_49_9]|nr:MAG: hypothetical protein UY50_C0009G0040 [Parcubacteria group bacterium GW2011_GWA2_49_9]
MNESRDIFLVANLGSEVTRLLHARSEHNVERMRGAYERACGIVEELTITTNEGGRQESVVLRTVLDDLVSPNPLLSINQETLKSYFLPFAHLVLGVGR